MALFKIVFIYLMLTYLNASAIEIIQTSRRRIARDVSTPSTHFYFKYQSPSHFKVSVSDIYITVPGLRTYFNVIEPTLFEITYQGSCEIHKGKGVHIKLLVDNHLMVGDGRTPNIPNRHLVANPVKGNSSAQFDQWLSQHHLPYEYGTLPIIQSAVVLVAPGFHIFDIGVHHGDVGLISVIFGGTMRFKWTVVTDPDMVHGLTMWNASSPVPSG